jgi:hypothetical protein
MPAPRPRASDVKELAAYFERNGYVRRVNAARRIEGQRYKKGDEVRLVAHSVVELAHIRLLLRRAGFEPGRPFGKGNQFRQPVYGRAEVARLLELIRAH